MKHAAARTRRNPSFQPFQTWRRWLPFLVLLWIASPLSAQDCTLAGTFELNGEAYDLGRIAQLTGRAPLELEVARRASTRILRPVCATAGTRDSVMEGISWLKPVLTSSFNSAYPKDRNNGALWSGKGAAAELHAGGVARIGPFSFGVLPSVIAEQNAELALAPTASNFSRFAAPYETGIDLPQRFGDGARFRLDAGQSFARIDVGPFAVGVSHENMWWGPLRITPLMLSNTAGGFPHVFIGTNRAVDVGIGRASFEAVWGQLDESAWFDTITVNDHRLFGGFVAGFEPHLIRGLSVGISRVEHQAGPFDDLGIIDLLKSPYLDVSSNAAGDNGLISIFARLALPGAGFEAFAELGRDDHWQDIKDLIKEPDHAQAYSLGFQQVVPKENGRSIRVFGEISHLEAALPLRGGRGAVRFYTNSTVIQGHTHDGQILGSWSGSGSSFQTLGIDRIEGERVSGVFLERTRYNTDIYHTVFSPQFGSTGHDIEVSLGAHQNGRRGQVLWQWRAEVTRRWNRNFLTLNRADPEPGGGFGFALTTRLAWR